MDSSKTSSTPSKPPTLTQRRRADESSDSRIRSAKAKTQSASEIDPAAKMLKTPVVSPSLRSAAINTVSLTVVDLLIAVLLLLAAIGVRLYRLTDIQKVIFDEVHYINFTNNVLRGQYFFDVNPVFGKLIIAFISKLFGFDHSLPNVELGDSLQSAKQTLAARIPSVMFGSITVPVFYRVCRLLHLSTYASVVGASFILFDMMHVIQSRITMVDSALVFFTCTALLFALYMWHAKNVVVIKRGSVSFIDAANVLAFLIMTGILCGLSVSVRWTAFATPMLIFTISMFGIGPFCLEPLNELELLVLYGSAFLAYCGSFAMFLWQVSLSGPGDKFMTPEFQACLVGSTLYTGPKGCQLSMWRRILELNATIFRYSKGIRGNDKWGSSWFQWIVNWRGALYYRDATPDDSSVSMIYLLMNPVMALSIDLLMLLFIVALFLTVRYRKTYDVTDALKQHLRRGGALFFGWVGSMLPTMVVYRSGPVYQYLPGLFFAQALAAIGFDLIPRPGRPIAAFVLVSLVIWAFVYWSPWVYGLELPYADHVGRRWLPRWD